MNNTTEKKLLKTRNEIRKQIRKNQRRDNDWYLLKLDYSGWCWTWHWQRLRAKDLCSCSLASDYSSFSSWLSILGIQFGPSFPRLSMDDSSCCRDFENGQRETVIGGEKEGQIENPNLGENLTALTK